MEIEDLGRILTNVHSDGKEGNVQKRNVSLFAIRYADDLKDISPETLSCHTGPTVPKYSSEINLAKQLSECVGLTNAAIRILEKADR